MSEAWTCSRCGGRTKLVRTKASPTARRICDTYGCPGPDAADQARHRLAEDR